MTQAGNILRGLRLLTAKEQELESIPLDRKRKRTLLSREIDVVRGQLPHSIVGCHDRLKARGRISIAPVRRGVCGACHLTLPIGSRIDLEMACELNVCDHCGTFIFLAEDEKTVTPGGEGEPRASHMNSAEPPHVPAAQVRTAKPKAVAKTSFASKSPAGVKTTLPSNGRGAEHLKKSAKPQRKPKPSPKAKRRPAAAAVKAKRPSAKPKPEPAAKTKPKARPSAPARKRPAARPRSAKKPKPHNRGKKAVASRRKRR